MGRGFQNPQETQGGPRQAGSQRAWSHVKKGSLQATPSAVWSSLNRTMTKCHGDSQEGMPEEVLGPDHRVCGIPQGGQEGGLGRQMCPRQLPLEQAPSACASWVPHKSWQSRSSGKGFGLAGSLRSSQGWPHHLRLPQVDSADQLRPVGFMSPFKCQRRGLPSPPLVRFISPFAFTKIRSVCLVSSHSQLMAGVCHAGVSPGAKEPLSPEGLCPPCQSTGVKYGSPASEVRVKGLVSESLGSELHVTCVRLYCPSLRGLPGKEFGE